jgi:succinate-semialdehyde dehydrogenase/glutarate-semialdehyde dehydrogenase
VNVIANEPHLHVPRGLLVGGRWIDPDAGFAVEDPSTGEELCEVGDARPEHAAAALDAAADAQEAWAATAPRTRSEILHGAFDRVHAESERFATLISLETGKTLAESRGEVVYGAEFLRWFAEEAVRPDGDFRVSPSADKRILASSRPVGPCLLVTPWNFPLAMITRKAGPALAAGCTAIVKPAPQTPLTALAIAEALVDCGLPEGVLSVLPTTGAAELVEPLLADRRLRKVSFTGSTAVGRLLATQAAPNLLRTSFELGGNAPFIVFDDADVERAVAGAMAAKLRNSGQSCTAANRILVQEGVADELSQALAAQLAAQRPGRYTDPDADVGPLIDATARERVRGLVDRAVAAGASVLAGGEAPGGPGYFYAPTLLAGVAADADVVVNEIFGPVVSVRTFVDEDDAVRQANATDAGLVAYLHTSDMDRALRVSDRLDVGMVGLNRGLVSEVAAPFGGVKQSGLGREGGYAGIREYQETFYLALDA